VLTLKTTHKIALARTAASVVMGLRRAAGRPLEARVRRGGLRWSLDLAEGIDFSIYLLGAFEPRTVRHIYPSLVRPGFTVLDIGANVGAHTLPLARLVGGGGRVIAFEPTQWAVEKLRRNLELNPALQSHVTVCHTMLVGSTAQALAPHIYASWPLFPQGGAVHQQHGGRLMETNGATTTTLDAALEQLGTTRVDFIKLDVDGHEPAVLQGAQETLRRFHPPILMEVAPYLFPPQTGGMESMLEQLGGLGYAMHDVGTQAPMPLDPVSLRGLIPAGASRNVVLRWTPAPGSSTGAAQ